VPTRMCSVSEARAAIAAIYRKRAAGWAVAQAVAASSEPGVLIEDFDIAASCEPVLVELNLRPPTEADALARPKEVSDWIAAWHNAAATEPVQIVWEERRWPSAGWQRIPTRIQINAVNSVARFAKQTQHWKQTQNSAKALATALPTTPAVVEAIRRVIGSEAAPQSATEADQLANVTAWLVANPHSGLFARQLPVRGVDTKWLSGHRGAVTKLVTAAIGIGDLGLATPPGLIRVRFCDSEMAPYGMRDVSAPAGDLTQLTIAPAIVLVLENLVTMLALPELPGVVAVLGQGYAVERLNEISWIANAKVLYWGDLDVDGFRILSMIRLQLPQARSILMDLDTVQACWDLGVPDVRDTKPVSELTAAEASALAQLRTATGAGGANWRIEQERIPWEFALRTLRSEIGMGEVS